MVDGFGVVLVVVVLDGGVADGLFDEQAASTAANDRPVTVVATNRSTTDRTRRPVLS
ncbi:MAG TPA: hypothetical protein VHW93_04840 [Acidimicrobiales bacterium]|nr:hypothetical protein [Acidimicrobiales bacterium]